MYPFLFVGGWVLVFVRLALGAIMIVHGFPKLKNLKATGAGFEGMGFRPGIFWGTVAALLESFGGIALIAGIFTVPLAAFFIVEFLVIIVWKIGKHMPFASGWELDLLILAAFAVLFFSGAGAISLDRFLFPGL